MITIAQFSVPLDAYLARCKLQAAGIPCFLGNEHLVNMYWLYSDAVGGVTLMVPDEFAAEARAVLKEESDHSDEQPPSPQFNESVVETADDAQSEELCPSCQSPLGPLQERAAGFGLSFLLIGMPLMPRRFVRVCPKCQRRISADGA
jgi:hypothetical protein